MNGALKERIEILGDSLKEKIVNLGERNEILKETIGNLGEKNEIFKEKIFFEFEKTNTKLDKLDERLNLLNINNT